MNDLENCDGKLAAQLVIAITRGLYVWKERYKQDDKGQPTGIPDYLGFPISRSPIKCNVLWRHKDMHLFVLDDRTGQPLMKVPLSKKDARELHARIPLTLT